MLGMQRREFVVTVLSVPLLKFAQTPEEIRRRRIKWAEHTGAASVFGDVFAKDGEAGFK